MHKSKGCWVLQSYFDENEHQGKVTACLDLARLQTASLDKNSYLQILTLMSDNQHTFKTKVARRNYQKLHRRKDSLFKRAAQYSRECDVDIQIIIRMGKTGKIFTLSSKAEGWPLSESQLVGLNKVNLTAISSVANLTRTQITQCQSTKRQMNFLCNMKSIVTKDMKQPILKMRTTKEA